MDKLPKKDYELLKNLINSKVEGICFCGMMGCNESFIHKSEKYAEATWGLILHLEDKDDVVFTWGEDKRVGDPFFIHLCPPDEFTKIDSLEPQIVTDITPWNKYVKKNVTRATVHSYSTNYGNFDEWHDVPWGVEIEFSDTLKMLIGALHHGDFMEYLICAEEVVILFDHELIDLAIKSRSDFKSEWSNY